MKTSIPPLACASLALLSGATSAQAQADEDLLNDVNRYVTLSLEDLLDQEVTSANKRTQRLSDVAAAVHVITERDIRSSGARSLPEALRLAPGVDVSQISADRWAVSIRGFTGYFSNKLLVLVDGRSAFSPFFNGVVWSTMLVPLENVERIEVVRGPGGSVWGVNAVNGVINIITKSSAALQGTQVVAGIDNQQGAFVQGRQGGQWSEQTGYSAYVRMQRGDGSPSVSGDADSSDAYHNLSTGFRIDHEAGTDRWTMTGNAYRVRSDGFGQVADVSAAATGYVRAFDYTDALNGADLQGRLTRRLSDTSTVRAGLSWTHSEYEYPTLAKLRHDMFDAELEHVLRLGDQHNITWGVDYRFYRDHFYNGVAASVDAARSNFAVASVFAQDEFALREDLRLTFGARLDHQKYTGNEFQPSVSLLWNMDSQRSLWTSVSRSKRIPSRSERDAEGVVSVVPPPSFGPLPVEVQIRGRHSVDSETMDAFEIGYRGQESRQLFIDATAYVHHYRDLVGVTDPDPADIEVGAGYLVLPTYFDNAGRVTTRGIEVSANWQPTDAWRLKGSYSYSKSEGDHNDLLASQAPRHIASLLTSWQVNPRTDVSVWLRHVSARPGSTGSLIDGYDSATVRLAWRPTRGVELSLAGENLLDAPHQEFASSYPQIVPYEVERSVYGQIRLDF